MHTVKRFHCDYCIKVLSNKSAMAAHEQRCPHNPKSRSCGTCTYLQYEDELVDGVPTHHKIAYCELDQFDASRITKMNPLGMRSNCDFHVVDPYKECRN